MSDAELEWQLLRWMCGWCAWDDALLKQALDAPRERLTEVQKSIRNIQVFNDPRTDLLYNKGVVNGGIEQAMASIADPEMAETAMILYSRLLSIRVFLNAPAAAPQLPDVRDPLPQEEQLPGDPLDAEVVQYLRMMGYDPGSAEVSLPDLVAQVKEKFAQAEAQRDSSPG
jgi:hypothetical protein